VACHLRLCTVNDSEKYPPRCADCALNRRPRNGKNLNNKIFGERVLTKSNPTVAQAPLIFSAASYNIHQAVGPDGRRDDRRIVQVLQNLDAGIIGLQEVDSQAGGNEDIFQLRYLTRETDFKAVAGPTLRRRGSDFGNVLLTRYKILEVRNVDLSVSRREPRGAIDVDLDIDGTIVRVIVTHLGLSGRERRRQTRTLGGLVSGHRDSMVVVLGDLNEWHPYGRSLRSMARYFGKSARLRTFPSWMPLFALDRIWVWPAQALVETKVHRQAPARSASDHLPIKAKITTAYSRSLLPIGFLDHPPLDERGAAQDQQRQHRGADGDEPLA
jgi:endonuclease/exonuclease/phosphatase family metal-dependent hydrolase